MKQYVLSQWQQILAFNQLDSFDALWDLQAPWVEEPNQRRGGWSGVCRVELKHPVSGTVVIYLKRQQNHRVYCWRHPNKGSSTFQREARNILSFTKQDIPTLTLIYFGEREHQGNNQAILVTEELTGYASLDDWLQRWQEAPLPVLEKKKVINKLAMVIRKMHDAGYRHGSLYPKHIYLKMTDEAGIDIRLIDLEKTRYWPFQHRRRLKDLSTLKNLVDCSDAQRLRFLMQYYRDVPDRGKIIKKLSKALIARQLKKEKSKQRRKKA